MYKIEELHKLLSAESKALKEKYSYKVGEEGLLRAYYFFRWADKKEYADLDKLVDAFSRNKVPEQQIEHFGCAFIMMDSYETDPKIKEALKYINEEFKKKKGVDVLDALEDAKLEKRILKNIYNIYRDSLDKLKKRMIDLKSSLMSLWIIIACIFIANIALAFTGVYSRVVDTFMPQLMKTNPIVYAYGAHILAGLVFIVLSLLSLIIMRRKVSEYASKSKVYPQEITSLEWRIKKFKEYLEGKKIKVNHIDL